MKFIKMTDFQEQVEIGIPNLLEKVRQMKPKPVTALFDASHEVGLSQSQVKKDDVFRKIIKQHLALSEMPGFNTKINGRQLLAIELMEGATEKLVNLKLWPYPEMNIDGIKFLAFVPVGDEDTEIEVLLTGDPKNTTKLPSNLVGFI